MNKEKKIIIITNELNRGGTEVQLLNLIKKIRKYYDITLFAFKSGNMLEDFKKQKVKLYVGGGSFVIIKFVLFLIFNKTNIYHFFLPKSYILGGILTFFSQKKKIMSRRSLNNYHKKYYYFSLFVEKILHKKMNLILTNSEASKNQLIKYEKVEKSKVRVIENFVSQVKIKNVFRSKDIVRFLYVANFIGYKSHEKLIQMCSKIKVKKRWELLLIGADRDGLKKKIKKQIENFNLKKKIKLLGEKNNLSAFYSSVDFAISTSAEEGSSNFLLESISYGLPIIAFDVGGNRKFFKNNGYLIKNYDYENFRKKIEQLIEGKEVKYLGKNSIKICAEKFDNVKTLKKYMSCYNNLLKN